MSRTALVSSEDLQAVQTTLDVLADADDDLRTLRDRCLRKEDHLRAGRLRVALNRLDEARALVAGCFT